MTTPSRNPLNRELAEGVRRVGFRKWYERELLSSHAHLLLTLLSVVGLLGSFEAFRVVPDQRLLNSMWVLVTAAIALWSLRRYLFLLTRAEDVANQASCGSCGEYGRFQVVGERRSEAETDVCCKRCANRWTINMGG